MKKEFRLPVHFLFKLQAKTQNHNYYMSFFINYANQELKIYYCSL